MYTALYRLDTHDIQHDLAHLYEHLVLHRFLRISEEHGFHPALIGWLVGDTFTECIYLDVGFYDPDVLSLFNKHIEHIGSEPDFNADELKMNLGLISAEDRALLTPVSYLKLNDRLVLVS